MSDNTVLFGKYLEPDEGNICGRLSLSFESGNLDMDELWESSSLSAQFLSTFWGKFFPIHDPCINKENIRDEVNYICSELLGNAVKFSFSPTYLIEIYLYLHERELRFYVKNSVNPDNVEKFQILIRKLLTEDPQELFFEQMEKTAAEQSHESGVGYLTMLNDYHVSLAWKFQSTKAGFQSVTTFVRMPIVRQAGKTEEADRDRDEDFN